MWVAEEGILLLAIGKGEIQLFSQTMIFHSQSTTYLSLPLGSIDPFAPTLSGDSDLGVLDLCLTKWVVGMLTNIGILCMTDGDNDMSRWITEGSVNGSHCDHDNSTWLRADPF